MATAHGLDGLRALTGTDLGYSDWLEVTQDRVNLFADASGDHQWIHTDPERAKDGPFGGACLLVGGGNPTKDVEPRTGW